MEQIIVKGKIEFCAKESKEYNREFTATVIDSPAFDYGNKTAVIITWGLMANGNSCDAVFIDTRYDRTLKLNEVGFKRWLQHYFEQNYGDHVLTLYKINGR